MASKTTIDRELPDGQMEILKITDGVFHRHVITPGQNPDTSNNGKSETAAVKLRVQELHTPEVVTAFQAAEVVRAAETAARLGL